MKKDIGRLDDRYLNSQESMVMDRWKEVVTRGNTEYSLKYFGNAILLYNQALDIARHEFQNTAEHSYDLAISKVMIAHMSLADSYLAIGNIERAGDFYSGAQEFLLDHLEGESSAKHEKIRALNHANSHLNSLWLDYVKKHRDNISYARLVDFHKKSIVLGNLEMMHCTFH
ncbi:hypothetical protein OAP18_00030 [Gammaproteobacteria bacterium]|nr:hypothetical protein [Gammaproteobacteria bacterium]